MMIFLQPQINSRRSPKTSPQTRTHPEKDSAAIHIVTACDALLRCCAAHANKAHNPGLEDVQRSGPGEPVLVLPILAMGAPRLETGPFVTTGQAVLKLEEMQHDILPPISQQWGCSSSAILLGTRGRSSEQPKNHCSAQSRLFQLHKLLPSPSTPV